MQVSMEGLIVDGFVVSAGQTKKAKLELVDSDKSAQLRSLLRERKYAEVVDFDEHFNEDVALDWTNPSFD